MPNQLCAKLLEPVQKLYVFLCIHQAYAVFSPNPAILNSHILASVVYEDGSTRIYPMIRIDRMSLIEKLVRERHRKFLEDNLPNPSNVKLLDDVARFVARQCTDLRATEQSASTNDGKAVLKPASVTLVYFWSETPAITMAAKNMPHFKSRVLRTYHVQPEDLK